MLNNNYFRHSMNRVKKNRRIGTYETNQIYLSYTKFT